MAWGGKLAGKRREQREGREATKAYLLNMKKEGFFLTLEQVRCCNNSFKHLNAQYLDQENFLRVEDHEEVSLLGLRSKAENSLFIPLSSY